MHPVHQEKALGSALIYTHFGETMSGLESGSGLESESEQLDVDITTMRGRARTVIPLLKAVSNENRLLILCYLGQGEMSVTELNDYFDLSQSALSQQLAKLREDGLVTTRRDSQTIYYSLASDEAARLIEFLHSEFCK